MNTKIVGILNLTPDSFTDGGRYLDKEKAIAFAREMHDAGAAYIDLGGQATGPGSCPCVRQVILAVWIRPLVN